MTDDGSTALADAVALLRAGEVVAFPTETVYGLGADATNPHAVARIFAIKGRPSFNPLIAHVASLEQALALGEFSGAAERLATAFWPGPLTVVTPVGVSRGVCDLARAGLGSIALRMPRHAMALALIEGLGRPIAAPSANRSGRVSPVSAAHVRADLGADVRCILDAGVSACGLESTIVGFLSGEATLLRPGAIAREEIEAALGTRLLQPVGNIVAPGATLSHYAPRATLRLNAEQIEPGEWAIDFAGKLAKAGAERIVADLSAVGDLREAAANLYTALRKLDDEDVMIAAVAPVPSYGLGEAINDRLRRAAGGVSSRSS